MKEVLFALFVAASLLLYYLFWSTDPRNVESFPVDQTGKYYNPY